MLDFISVLVIGLLCIAIGIVSSTGNLMFIKKRNKRNVSEGERLLFGRLCGIASILIGIGFIIFGALMQFFGEKPIVGVVLIPFLVVAAGLMIYATLRFNRK